ncbi:uncharacterized protein LOC143886411 [Tasmannia lanceolata]|uniref:uncharacterized protein LOC143886411 n=1 Tax=Tasmannia lanceolata TaxID=3420 RepID=UPI0040630439
MAVPSTSSSSFPVTSMTSIKLDGSNYPAWSRSVQFCLCGQGKLSFITLDPPNPKDSSYDKWSQEDAQLQPLLCQSMDSKIASHMLFLNTFHTDWQRAETLYSGTNNLTRICDVYTDLFSAKRGERSVSEYYSDFVSLCEQIDIYHPPSTDLAELAKQKSEIRVVRFLDGLGRYFLPIRQQILGLGTLPDMDEVFSRVQQALSVDTQGDIIGEQPLPFSLVTVEALAVAVVAVVVEVMVGVLAMIQGEAVPMVVVEPVSVPIVIWRVILLISVMIYIQSCDLLELHIMFQGHL